MAMPVEGRDGEVVTVTMLKHFASYNAGEVAAFLPEQVAILIENDAVDPDALTNNAPVNLDAPYVSQAPASADLTCTMGNWTGSPTGYAYQWQVDGVNVGTDANTYTSLPADIGRDASCLVTATNGIGSTVGPMSNYLQVADPAATRSTDPATRAPEPESTLKDARDE
jgi:hypothetical protein